MAKTIDENDMRLLSEYLAAQVISGLSGRDGADTVDATPARNIFAGVLHPVRTADLETVKETATGGDAPSGTALGLDFRIAPEQPGATVRLRVTPSWSHYYAIFPSWAQARAANEALVQAQVATSAVDPANSGRAADVDVDMREEPVLDGDDGDESDEIPAEEAQAANVGKVILPRVFRRLDVRPGSIVVEVTPNSPQILQIVSNRIEEAIEGARARVEADPQVWRYLGSAEQRERSLGDASVLTSEDTYNKALLVVKGDKVTAPLWSASLQVESTDDPGAPGALRVRILLANTTPDRDGAQKDPGLEERALLDAGLEVNIEGARVVSFDFLLAPKDYRNKPQMPAKGIKGINCTAAWDRASRTGSAPKHYPSFGNRIIEHKSPWRLLSAIL
jgi:hypothetical protein